MFVYYAKSLSNTGTNIYIYCITALMTFAIIFVLLGSGLTTCSDYYNFIPYISVNKVDLFPLRLAYLIFLPPYFFNHLIIVYESFVMFCHLPFLLIKHDIIMLNLFIVMKDLFKCWFTVFTASCYCRLTCGLRTGVLIYVLFFFHCKNDD